MIRPQRKRAPGGSVQKQNHTGKLKACHIASTERAHHCTQSTKEVHPSLRGTTFPFLPPKHPAMFVTKGSHEASCLEAGNF